MNTRTTHTSTDAGQRRTVFSSTSMVALGLVLLMMPAAATNAHSPLTRADGPAVTDPALMGGSTTVDLGSEIETLIVNDQIDAILGETVSPGAKLAARQAYAQAVFQPLWTRDAAERLMEANLSCAENGVESGYTDEDLKRIIDARFTGTDAQKARADITLTATWLTLASVISGGLSDEGEMVQSTEARPTRSDLVVSLRQAGQGDPIKAMEELASSAPQYFKLKESLKTYRNFAESGGWMKIRDGEEMLEPGMDDPRVPALRQRLKAEGYDVANPLTVPPVEPVLDGFDLPIVEASIESVVTPSKTFYDDTLADQVKAFQGAHGLERDGVLGPATLAALNESVESKINRIQMAMDHWRENSNPGERYIWVNIPSYRAEAWTGNRQDVVMDTIVGKKRTPTTAFSDEIEYVVVNPKWFLPIGLFKRQKLWKLRNDPGYAAKHNYVIYDRASGEQLNPYSIDWDDSGVASRIQMVQTPGPHNALGQLKIIFPNQHSIYLHDTPDRHLFERDVRALSSGCIRLEDPVKMANWLTDGDDAVSTRVFNATLESRKRDRFHLDTHVPVHLTYLPAVVGPEGHAEFPADIYQRFNAPALAKGTYPDDIKPEQERDLFVGLTATPAEGGPQTRDLQ